MAKQQTEMAEKMNERAEALADSLIEIFGYTDGQLVASLTMAAIGRRLVDNRLNGQGEPAPGDKCP